MNELEIRRDQCKKDIEKLQQELKKLETVVQPGDIYTHNGTRRMYTLDGKWIFLDPDCAGVESMLTTETVLKCSVKE